eukprot:7096931-Prymnesium_polylepis.1
MQQRKEKKERERLEALEHMRLHEPERYAEHVANETAKAERTRRREELKAERAAAGRNKTARVPREKRATANVTGGAARNGTSGRVTFTFSDDARARISASLRALWKDPEYRARRQNASVSAATRAKLSERMKAKWQDGDYRERNTVNGSHSEERRRKIS